MQPPQLAESAARERLLRCAEQLEAHDRESERRAGVRAKLVATLARLQLAAEREEALALEAFSVLPRELTRLIFGWLPADARLRCREVCKPWWAFLEERRLWWSLDLSQGSGVLRRSEALLHKASRRAGRQLRVLDVSGWHKLSLETLLAWPRRTGRASELRPTLQPRPRHGLTIRGSRNEVLQPCKLRLS